MGRRRARRLRLGFGRVRQSGFTLMEVLVAVTVIAVGLAGLASMQLTTLQFAHSSHYRSLASAVALDLEERLWIALASDSLTGCPDVSAGEGSTAETLLTDWARDYGGGEGDGAWNWSSARLTRVPNLTLTVGTATTGTRFTEIPVTMTWNESRFSDVESTTESFTYNIRILCRVTVSS